MPSKGPTLAAKWLEEREGDQIAQTTMRYELLYFSLYQSPLVKYSLLFLLFGWILEHSGSRPETVAHTMAQFSTFLPESTTNVLLPLSTRRSTISNGRVANAAKNRPCDNS